MNEKLSTQSLDFITFALMRISRKWMRKTHEVYEILNRSCVLDDYLIEYWELLKDLGELAPLEDLTKLVIKNTSSNVTEEEVDTWLKSIASSLHNYEKDDISKEDNKDNVRYYKQYEIERILIIFISQEMKVSLRKALDMYYTSSYAKKVEKENFIIENLDFKALIKSITKKKKKHFFF